MAFETITVDVEDKIAVIRLNRPDALNALNAQLIEELQIALREADKNDKARVIVVTGTEKAFAAGADIKEMEPLSFADAAYSDLFADLNTTIAGVGKPIIAAVSGYALGGGCELAMACDFILASETAKFGQPEINLGAIPGLGGTQRLTRFVGKSKAMDMVLTGRFMDADEAERSGLVSSVFPTKTFETDVMAVAEKIAEKSTLATRYAKEAVNRSYESTLAEGLLFERRLFHALFATDDRKEGMLAFVEKREAKFRDN